MEKDEQYIVGIGASAGGLEALNRFFENIPDNTGLSFVVVQHLSPDHESHMASLLGNKTNMNVYQIRDGMEIEPNSVYLIPPNNNIIIYDKNLYLKEPDEKENRYLNLPIDIFFKSLAESEANKAIGIILSGTGSDGVRGIRAIKEKQGMVMVQDKETARFDGMPVNAISTGIVDYIIPPEEMGDRLLKYIEHPYLKNKKDKSGLNSNAIEDNSYFKKILIAIKEENGIDFFQYKKNTVIRRIERRMIINQINKIENYYNFIQKVDSELEVLARELLIGVTNFFRDEKAFEVVKNKVIPDIVQQKETGDEIRLWVAGCSTGEEVYSLAILFNEYLEENGGNHKLKIFATDIQESALRKASIGEYPGSIVADVSMERLKKYFVKKDKSYKINKSIREMVIFSKHNLIKDPPFHKIDLISCRNLLIYLKQGVQQKVLSNFRFSLNNQGYLFLGSSESLGEMFDDFKPLSTKWNIYQCKGCVNKLDEVSKMSVPKVDSIKNKSRDFLASNNYNYRKSGKRKLEDKIKDALLKQQLADTVVIDEKNQLTELVGDVNKYFNFPENKISLNILDLCPENLSQAIGIAINKVKRDKEEVIYENVEFENNGVERVVDIHFNNLKISGIERDFIAIKFINKEKEESYTSRSVVQYEQTDHSNQRIKDLEQELAYTRENLQATIEELETSNEELQATNEELMASNQELQSTNEELESVNEELLTVNAEHQQKIEELTKLNNDMDNLLKSTKIGAIFISENLEIRKTTPVIEDLFQVKKRDEGRPLSEVKDKIKIDNLLEIVKKTHNKGDEVTGKIKCDKDTYLYKLIPYITRREEKRGSILTLININRLEERNKELQKLSYAVEHCPFITVITDKYAKIEYVNEKFSEVTGYSEKEVIGEEANVLKSGDLDRSYYNKLWNSIKSGESWQGMFINKTKDDNKYKEYAHIFPLLNEDGDITNYIKFSISEADDFIEVEGR